MRSIKLVIIGLFFSIHLFANDNDQLFSQANELYSNAEYKKAVEKYEMILRAGYESFELYYNIGNSYYKLGEYGKAILSFERAKKIEPDNEDLNFNLKIANQKVEDKIDSAPSLFLTQWKTDLIGLMNEMQWSWLTICCFVLTLLLFFIYINSSRRKFKQIGFFGGLFFFVFTLFGFYFAKTSYSSAINKVDAIILAPSVTVVGAPNEKATKLFQLHEGTKVVITDREESGWVEIKIANGNSGWVKEGFLSKI